MSIENFNFMTTTDCGPEHAMEVKKKDGVFAYRLSKADEAKIKDFKPREGDYDDSYKRAGNWLCTAKVGKSAGEFWIVKAEDFGVLYDEEVADSQAMIKEVCGYEFKFEHHLVKDSQICFRLPLKKVPDLMKFGGKDFVPGDYVFIKNKECDIWARSAEYMQTAYFKVSDVSKNEIPKKVTEQYKEIINSGK